MTPTSAMHNGFADSLRAEWAAFRSSRARLIGVVVAAVVTVLPGLLIATGSSCSGPNGNVCPAVPLGPSCEAVTTSSTSCTRR